MHHRCLTDISGPFYDPEKPFRNWSALPFYQLDQKHSPYVNQTQLDWGTERALVHLERVRTQGYTGIVIDNLAHLVSLDHAPIPIYGPDSPYRFRAATYRRAFGHLFDAAVQAGMEVFVTTDMQWCTPPIRRYVGQLTPHNPRLDTINRCALDELFTRMPQVRGIVVRVGETGGAHDLEASYTGHMLYTTVQNLRHLIDTLLPICERHNRLLILRTWSIGIGELGDLMWSPQRYHKTFGSYRSPHLIVSLKHSPSDFFRLLPHNPTAGLDGPAQIIELQNRREYELFGMVPGAVIPLHQEIIQRQTASNPRFRGIWAWNSSGGWGGGRAALGTEGWSVWTELSSAVTAALMHDPERDTQAFVRAWCAAAFGEPFGQAVAEVYIESSRSMEEGWYIQRLTRGEQAMGTLYLPSLLWVWWMRPTASLLIWAYLSSAIEETETVLQQGAAVRKQLAWHAERLARLAPANDPAAGRIVESVRYFHDVMLVAQATRTLMLRAFDAAWEGRRERWNAIVSQSQEVQATLHEHRARWSHNHDFPSLELEEIEAFLGALQRTPTKIWLQSRGACLLVRRLRQKGQVRGNHLRLVGAVAASLLLVSLFTRERKGFGIAGACATMLLASPLRQRMLHALLPWANRRFYLLPSIFFETGPSLKEWTA